MMPVDFGASEPSYAGASKIHRGDTALSASGYNALVRAANAARPVYGQDTYGMQTPYGFITYTEARRKVRAEPRQLQAVNASTAETAAVKVTFGTVSGDIIPKIGDVAITADPAPKLTVTGAGFVVLKTTWTDDDAPRTKPLAAVFEFSAGDPDGDYTPPAQTRTEGRLVMARVWTRTIETEGQPDRVRIAKIKNTYTGSILVGRQIWGQTTFEFVGVPS